MIIVDSTGTQPLSAHPVLKTATERVEHEVTQILSGERSYTPGLVDPSLNSTEQRLKTLLIAEIRAGRHYDDIEEETWRLDYATKPPGIREFLLNDYYLGKTWRPVEDDNTGIWPAWLTLFEENLDIDSRIHNMILTGSLGIGKCLGYGEKCMMFDGSLKEVQNIKPGEKLMGDDSTPRTVLSTTSGTGDLFQIYPAKGEPFVCNGDHVLCLKTAASDVVEHVSVYDFLKWPTSKKHSARIYRSRHEKRPDYLKTKFAVIPKGVGAYYGFELDGNHRFLLKDFTVSHNTSLMVTALLYRVCISTHLKNPQHFFGLSRNSNLVYNFLSVTKDAVKDTAYGTAMDYMGDSQYFLEVCKFNPDLDYSGYRIPMENVLPDGGKSGIWISAGSKGQHVLGRNLIGVGLDEGNFRLEKNPDLTAYQLYDQVRTRIANRFQKIEGYLPALCVIASSAQDESSFTEKVSGEIEESNRLRDVRNRQLKPGEKPERQTQIVFRNAIYKIKRHALPGIGKDHHWFKVAYGLKNMEPFILSGWYKEDGSQIEIEGEKHEDPPAGARTEMVPKFYWEAYRRNCKSQLQNLSGISCGGAHRLFPSMIDVEWCLEESIKDGTPDPMQKGVSLIPVSVEDNKQIWNYLDHKKFLTIVASKIQPIRHPQRQRYAHVDLATQTMCGLSICHLAGTQRIDGLVRDGGEPYSEYRLMVEYDFILTLVAGQNKPINFAKIQKFFYWLREECGYRFGKVTFDQWQSEGQLQELESKNFEVEKLSIDKDKSVYTAWRAGFEEHRIRLPRSEQMIREAENLLEMDKKFDHPPETGTKDTIDSASGCYWGAITSDERLTIASHNAPTLYTGQQMHVFAEEKPPIDIPLPERGYSRTRVFRV